MTVGRTLDDAKVRAGYKVAESFVADLSLDTPNQTHHENENDQIAFMLQSIKDLWDTIITSSITVSGVMLFPQFIAEDITIPPNFDGATFSRGMADGFTMTVSDGSILHWNGGLPPA